MKNPLFSSVKEWLERPLPFYENYRQKIFIPVLLTFAVMLGVLILSPTENADVLLKQMLYVFIYGLIVIVDSLLFTLLLPELFPKIYNTERWNVKKTLVIYLLAVFTIAIGATLFAFYFDNPDNKLFLAFFFTILTRSFALSFFPIIILVFYKERRLYRKNYLRALELSEDLKTIQKTKQSESKNVVYTFADNTKDEIKISENDLVYIKAEGNYCLLVHEKDLHLQKNLIRSSLKEIEHLISDSNHFLRCHKSYIINLNKTTDVKGNARGYTYYLQHDCKIPSSRNTPKSLINQIKNNKDT